jgi:hypothetical protein
MKSLNDQNANALSADGVRIVRVTAGNEDEEMENLDKVGFFIE